MADLRDLYQEIILDHNRSPRNFKRIEDATSSAEGFNPLCGDQYTVFVKMDGDKIADVAFQGAGCAISKASASVMSTIIKGKTRAEAEELFSRFHEVVTSSMDGEAQIEGLGKLAAFAGVREFPARIKCATLAWHTLNSALNGEAETVSTE